MALSQDEQRMLAEIERRLAADDPGLASCLTSFRRPGPATVLRSPRARIIGSLFTVLLVAMVALMVYAMIPFRTHLPRSTTTPTTAANTVGAPSHTAISAQTNQPNSTPQTLESLRSSVSSAGLPATNRSTAASKPQRAKVKPAGATILSEAPSSGSG